VPERIREQVRTYVLDTLAPAKGVMVVDNDESLIDAGVVDSLGIFQLVAFLEDECGVRITDDEIAPENFGTLSAIERFVTAKLHA
jgi:acyl carrier protein